MMFHNSTLINNNFAIEQFSFLMLQNVDTSKLQISLLLIFHVKYWHLSKNVSINMVQLSCKSTMSNFMVSFF